MAHGMLFENPLFPFSVHPFMIFHVCVMLTRSAFDGSKHVDNVLDHGKLRPKSCKKRRRRLLFLKGKVQ